MAKNIETIDDAELAFDRLVKWDAIDKNVLGEGDSDDGIVSNRYTVFSYMDAPDDRSLCSLILLTSRSEDGSDPVIGIKPVGSDHPRMYLISSISAGADGMVVVGIPDNKSLMFREMKL